MKLQKNIWPIVVLTILLGAGCSTHKKARITLPANTLNSEQLYSLFVGNTVESVSLSKGRKSLTYYDPDGQVRQQRGNQTRLGQWRITKRGRICLQMENKKKKCRIILRENGTYKKYIVKKSGDHKLVVSFTRFMPGNPLGL